MYHLDLEITTETDHVYHIDHFTDTLMEAYRLLADAAKTYPTFGVTLDELHRDGSMSEVFLGDRIGGVWQSRYSLQYPEGRFNVVKGET